MIYAVTDKRESGKTELAIDLWLADPANTIFVCMSVEKKKQLIERMGDKFPTEHIGNILPFHVELLRGRKVEKLVWDEPYYKDKWVKLLEYLWSSSLGHIEVTLTGTFKDAIKDAAKLAKFKAVHTNVKEYRLNHFWASPLMKDFEQFYDEQTNEEL